MTTATVNESQPSDAQPWTRLRMKPKFVIIGQQKCGTTTLYHLMCQHPQIKAAARKELNFFNKNYFRGLEWYEKKFPSTLVKSLGKLRGQEVITGEASPYYMFHPLSAMRMAPVLPEAKLIVLLRNPVDRAYSHFNHATRGKRETLPFEEALAKESVRLAGETEKLMNDERYFSFNHRYWSYTSRGIYVDQLKEFRKYFAEKQFLVIKSEEFFIETQKILDEVFSFVGVDPWQPPHLKPMNTGTYSEIKLDTREQLRKFFEPHNERLYHYLGRDLGW